MSAWIVSKGHIDALVQSLVVEGLVPMDKALEVGQMLWHENHLSIQARYGDEPNTPDYTPEMIEVPLDDAIIAMQARCFDYQTCEHEDYETSDAKRLMDALVELLRARNGGGENWPHDVDRGGRLPWGVKSVLECVAR